MKSLIKSQRGNVIAYTFLVSMLCGCLNSSKKDDVRSPEVLSKVEFKEKELIINDYPQWLKNQKGITFDESENEKIHVSLLYKPLVFEAAMSGRSDSDSSLEAARRNKVGYHYFRLQWLDKNTSIIHPTDKKKMSELLKNNLFVIQAQDTLKYNVETISASLLNQPNEILVMVPCDTSAGVLYCKLSGAPVGLRDLQLSITEKQLKTFPGIKI